jgi:ribonuclease D
MAGDETHLEAVAEHPLAPSGEPELITTGADLANFLDHVRETGSFAYDTEFIGELSYAPHICLIQVATPDRIALIDPLAEFDLDPLWEAIADPTLLTILHAGIQDLEPVVRFIGKAPANILDTQIAAGFVGMPYPVALRRVVEVLVGVRLGKGFTFTQWDQRPLSARHLRYAADDVRYLPAVWNALRDQLDENGHRKWAEAECAKLCDIDRYRFDADTQVLRVRSSDSLDGRAMARLRELVIARDAAAQADDVPVRGLLKDDVLVRLARQPVTDGLDLRAVRGFPRPVAERHGDAIVTALGRGEEAPPIRRPRVIRDEDASARIAADALLIALSSFCLGQSIDPSLVVTRSDVAAIVRRVRRDEDLSAMPLFQTWRGELLLPWLTDFLTGNATLSLSWADGRLRHEG